MRAMGGQRRSGRRTVRYMLRGGVIVLKKGEKKSLREVLLAGVPILGSH